MKTAIVNLGVILTGDWREPRAPGDSIVMDEGRIVHVGTAAASQIAACDVVIDADGATAIPGLIDSHVHITFYAIADSRVRKDPAYITFFCAALASTTASAPKSSALAM